jgi:hypothetical protein
VICEAQCDFVWVEHLRRQRRGAVLVNEISDGQQTSDRSGFKMKEHS